MVPVNEQDELVLNQKQYNWYTWAIPLHKKKQLNTQMIRQTFPIILLYKEPPTSTPAPTCFVLW